MAFFQLRRLYDFSLRALEKPSAYLKGVPGDTTLYRCACCRSRSLTSFKNMEGLLCVPGQHLLKLCMTCAGAKAQT